MSSRTSCFSLLVVALTSSATRAADPFVRVECVVDASAAEVWGALTTSDGLRAWRTDAAAIELELGGAFEVDDRRLVGGDAPVPARSVVLAFEPERTLALRFAAAPHDVSSARATELWQVWRLEAIESDSARVTLTTLGIDGEDEATKLALEDRSWAEIEMLRKHFANHDGASRRDVTEQLTRCTEKNWVAAIDGNGGSIPYLLTVVRTPAPNSFYVAARVGTPKGPRLTHLGLVWVDTMTGRCRVQVVAFDGESMRGVVRPDGSDATRTEFDRNRAGGTRDRLVIRAELESDERLVLTSLSTDEGPRRPRQVFRFEAVTELPPSLRKADASSGSNDVKED